MHIVLRVDPAGTHGQASHVATVDRTVVSAPDIYRCNDAAHHMIRFGGLPSKEICAWLIAQKRTEISTCGAPTVYFAKTFVGTLGGLTVIPVDRWLLQPSQLAFPVCKNAAPCPACPAVMPLSELNGGLVQSTRSKIARDNIGEESGFSGLFGDETLRDLFCNISAEELRANF